MNISFHKPHLSQEEIDSVTDTIRSGWLTMGPITLDFEKCFKQCIKSQYAVSLNSATAALHLSLNALDINKNDEVIIPTTTFIATAEAVTYLGAKPVLCDIDYKTHNINPNLIEPLITSRTKAIIPVHYGGHPCDMDKIISIAKKFNLKVIEDAAHALPSYYQNRKIGTISDATCFSFYATKTLTTGEGGMVSTNDKNVAEKIKIQRLHGINREISNRHEADNNWFYDVVDLGFKYNITDIQSSIGLIQLKKLEWMRNQRKKIAQSYLEAFSGKIECVKEPINCESSWHLFVIKVNNRNQLFKELKKNGISTSVHFIPIHKHSYYKNKFSYKDGDFINANNIYNKSLSLPIYPGLTDNEVEYIIKNVLQFAA